eukprot:4123686-Ditylum_brightwellii.AAC.1
MDWSEWQEMALDWFGKDCGAGVISHVFETHCAACVCVLLLYQSCLGMGVYELNGEMKDFRRWLQSFSSSTPEIEMVVYYNKSQEC